MEKWVDIIIPCYNMEKYLERFIDRIIGQTYDKIRLIFINDGSKDNTESIIFSKRSIVETRGYKFIYKLKENGGLPMAIKFGLTFLEGEYFTWVDPDDFLSDNAIKEKVEFLQNNKEYGFVRANAYMRDEVDINKIIGEIKSSDKEQIFEDLILENNMPLTAGNYLLRRNEFILSNKQQEIYCNARGQNWQMLLPIAYKYRCGYIDNFSNNYVVIEGSMSHSDKGFESEIYRMKEHKEILLNTMKVVEQNNNNFNLEYYSEIILEKYNRRELQIAFKYDEKNYFMDKFNKLKNKNKVDIRMKMIISNKIIKKVYLLIKNIRKKIMKVNWV